MKGNASFNLFLTSRQCTCEATQNKTCITMAVGLFSEAETRGAVGLRFEGLFQILYSSMFPNFQKRQVCFAKEPLKIDHVTAYRHMAGGMLKWKLREELGL